MPFIESTPWGFPRPQPGHRKRAFASPVSDSGEGEGNEHFGLSRYISRFQTLSFVFLVASVRRWKNIKAPVAISDIFSQVNIKEIEADVLKFSSIEKPPRLEAIDPPLRVLVTLLTKTPGALDRSG